MKSLQILHTCDELAILKQEVVQENTLQGLWPASVSEGNQWILSLLAQQSLKLLISSPRTRAM